MDPRVLVRRRFVACALLGICLVTATGGCFNIDENTLGLIRDFLNNGLAGSHNNAGNGTADTPHNDAGTSDGSVTDGGAADGSVNDGGTQDSGTSVGSGTDAGSGADTSSGVDTGSGADTSSGVDAGGGDGAGDTGVTIDLGGQDGAGGTDRGSFTPATIIHRGSGGFLADPVDGIPASANYNRSSDGSIGTQVQRTRMSADGHWVWFSTDTGFVTPQLFCINTDGSGLKEFTLPADMLERPSEMAVSADGQSCAMIFDLNGDGFLASQSVIVVVDRLSGVFTTALDARNFSSSDENDFVNLQMTGDGLTLFFQGNDTGIIYRMGADGSAFGSFVAPGEFVRADSVVSEPDKFRINSDASSLVAIVAFDDGNGGFPRDVYLVDASGVSALTNTGDATTANDNGFTDLDVSDDGRFVTYRRTSGDQTLLEMLDRTAGTTTTLSTLDGFGLSFQTLLADQGSIVFAASPALVASGNTTQLPAMMTPDGTRRLQFRDGWLSNNGGRKVQFESISAKGDVLTGQWNNGSFGDPSRVYVWFPGVAVFRTGPQVGSVEFKLDAAAGTLTVRATVNGPVSNVRLFGFKDNFESLFQLPESEDPFFTERLGFGDMTLTDSVSVYERTVDFPGLSLDSSFRVRIAVSDDGAKNFSYVDFRPIAVTGELLDLNGDGTAD